MLMKHRSNLLFIIIFLLAFYGQSVGEEKPAEKKKIKAPEKWGIAMGIRSARIPFDTNKSVVNDVIPLIFYDNGRLFIDGLEAGYRL